MMDDISSASSMGKRFSRWTFSTKPWRRVSPAVNVPGISVNPAFPAAWDAVITDLTDLGRLLVRRGPFPVLDRLVVRAERLRARPDAARRLTDFRHLGELAQARFEDGADAAAVVRWLAGGAADWKAYLDLASSAPGDRTVYIEFVKDDAPENFLADAATLRNWLSAR